MTAYGGPTHATGSQQNITPNVQSLIQDGGVLILTAYTLLNNFGETITIGLVPPPRLICRTINKLISEKGKGSLVIPLWKSAPFWPMLKKGDKWEHCVKDQRYFTSYITQKGRGENGIFGSSKVFNMVIVRIEFD